MASESVGNAQPTDGVPRFKLWRGAWPPPTAAEVPVLKDVRVSVIQKRQPEVDGYDWLHGVAVIRFNGVWFASWGNNKGRENTVGEVVRGRRSRDDGATWSEPEYLGPSIEGEARSHGVFLEHGGQLSTGQRFLIANTVRDHSNRRDYLTIAVSRPGEKTLCRMWRIRDATPASGPAGRRLPLSYPHAVEHAGSLYVVYSASAVGGNRNNAELAVFKVSALAVE